MEFILLELFPLKKSRAFEYFFFSFLGWIIHSDTVSQNRMLCFIILCQLFTLLQLHRLKAHSSLHAGVEVET